MPIPRGLNEEVLHFFRNLRTHLQHNPTMNELQGLTCVGVKKDPHSWTSLVNMLYGPHLSTFRSLPKTESSS